MGELLKKAGIWFGTFKDLLISGEVEEPVGM